MRKRTRRTVFALAALSGSALVAVLLAELAVRILFPPALWKSRDSVSDWAPDARLGWVQKGNLEVETREEAGWVVRFSTNPDGLTPAHAERPRKPGVFRVLLFGDSTVVGRSVPQDSTVAAFLERELETRGVAAEVFNAGVEGYSTDQAMIRMELLLPIYQPDLTLLVVCDNDLAGNSLDYAYGMPKPRFRLNRAGQLVEIAPPELWRPRPASGFRAFVQGSALYRLTHPWLLQARAAVGGWEERTLLGLAPEIYYDPQGLERFDWALFEAMVGRMKTMSASGGSRFAFFAHPALAEVWDPYIRRTLEELSLDPDQYDRYALEKKYAQIGRAADADFVPLVDFFLSRAREGPFHLLPRDPHCSPTGYRITAEALAERIL